MFTSCLIDPKSQVRCHHTYDATNLDQRREFIKHLYEILRTLSCKNFYVANGILRQIPEGHGSLFEIESTRDGLATVLLEQMRTSQLCPGLARLSAEDKTKLEQLAKEETEQELAAKVAGADQR